MTKLDVGKHGCGSSHRTPQHQYPVLKEIPQLFIGQVFYVCENIGRNVPSTSGWVVVHRGVKQVKEREWGRDQTSTMVFT